MTTYLDHSMFSPTSERAACPSSVQWRDGMTLVELLLSGVVISIVLGALVLVSQSLRTEACDQQTRSTLHHLRTALHAYHEIHQSWPPGPTTALAVQRLLTDAGTAALVRSLDLGTDIQGQTCVRDGYGNPVRYVIQSRQDTAGADFISAGPNGRFGDLNSSNPKLRDDAADNLHGFDLETPVP